MNRTTANGVVQEPLLGHPVMHNPYAIGAAPTQNGQHGNVSQQQPEAAPQAPNAMPSFVQQPP